MKQILTIALVLVLAMSLFIPMSPAVSAAEPYRPLVGMWHFDNTTGDSSGYNNFGTRLPSNSTGPQFVPGKFGQALKFDGVDDSVRVLDSNSLDVTNSLTIEAWVKLDDWFNPRSFVVSKSTFPNQSYILNIGGDNTTSFNPAAKKRVLLSVSDNGSNQTTFFGVRELSLNQWYHIAATYDYIADNVSLGRIFIDGILDNSFIIPRGRIYQGTANLTIGQNTNGTIDEVHVWNTPHPIYSVFVNPFADVNPVGTQHTVNATVRANIGDASVPKPTVAGVPVNFLFSDDSVNHPAASAITTNSIGEAQFTYTDTSAHGGVDFIATWVDQDWSNDSFDPSLDAFAVPRKSWVENFVTGGGNVKEGKKVTWTFDGTLGVLPGGGVAGIFEIVNHQTGITYYSDNFTFINFSGDNTTSPSASNNQAFFRGFFTDDAGNQVALSVWLLDLGEPGDRIDKIMIADLTGLQPPPLPVWPPLPPIPPSGSNIWIGTTDNPATAEPVVIHGGNFQVHNAE